MAVFLCRPCGVTIIENNKDVKPACPRCRKDMLPKSGPGSIEEQFPDKAHEDTVLQLNPLYVPKAEDVKRKEPPQ
jgi:DNA-directed RNA polymerase subunit RPC12/RpoP